MLIAFIERVQEKGTRNQFPFPSPREKKTNGNQKLLKGERGTNIVHKKGTLSTWGTRNPFLNCMVTEFM